MKRRLLTIMFAVMLVATFMTATALADDVGSTLDFTVSETTRGEGWSWDAETKTLTLDNLNFTTDAQYGIILPSGSTINVPAGTTNTIETKAVYNEDAVSAAIYCKGDLTITGSGEIKAESTNGNAIFLADRVSAELTISRANVSCTSKAEKGNAVYLSSENNMAANVKDSVLNMDSYNGLAIGPMKSTEPVTVSFDIDNSSVTASGKLIYGGFWNNADYKPSNCAISVELTDSNIKAPNGAISLDSRDCAASTFTMLIDHCDAVIKGIKALNIVGAASVDVRDTNLSMPSNDTSGTMFHIGGYGNKTVNIEESTVDMDGQFFLDDNGDYDADASITDSITIKSSELSVENDGAAWTVGDGIRLGEKANNVNLNVSDSKLDIICEGNGVAVGNDNAAVKLSLDNTNTTVEQTVNNYIPSDSNKDSKKVNGYNAFKVYGVDETSDLSITDGTIVVSMDVDAKEELDDKDTALINVSGQGESIDSTLLGQAGLVVYNNEGKLLNNVKIEEDIELPDGLRVVGEAKLEVAPGVTVTMGDEKIEFESGGTMSVGGETGSANLDIHYHTPADAVRENEVPATYSSTGSYEKVIYCAECDAELSRETITTPKLVWSSIPTNDITVTQPANGTVKVNPSNGSAGTLITVTATPDEGYELAYITVDGEKISGSTFRMPDKAVTVSAVFVPVSFPFVDVKSGDWFYDYVAYVYSNGLMDGTSATTFEPNANMTRAMVWAILARIDGETVTGADWANTARAWAMAEGVSDGTDANGLVTREQFATMLYRYAAAKGYDVPIGESTNILSYADYDEISEWAIPAMQWACGSGIITGVTESTLVPKGTATRAQCAAMLMRFVEL